MVTRRASATIIAQMLGGDCILQKVGSELAGLRAREEDL